MNNKKEITLKDFLDLLDIPKGCKRSHAKLVLYTVERDLICTTYAHSIGTNPYLDKNVVTIKACHNISELYYEIILDVYSGEIAEKESSNGDN